jgi:hypothetical protein
MAVVSAKPVPKSITVPRQEAISVPKSVPKVEKSDTVPSFPFPNWRPKSDWLTEQKTLSEIEDQNQHCSRNQT